MIIISIVIAILLLSILLCMIQVIRGATLSDRVVSIDALTSLSVGVFVLFAVEFREVILLDVALVYALIAFIADLAVAKYLEGRGLEE